MNNSEFLSEAKEYLDNIYERFQGYQDLVNDIFDYFHRVCIKNDICYYLAFGSLLGVIRDGGNIPWDYDIDVVVPYTEKSKLINALDSDKNDLYYYVYKNNTQHYPTSCLRVCKKGYSYMALHVDVFFLIGCADDEKVHDRFYNEMTKVYHARQALNLDYHLKRSGNKTLKSLAKRAIRYLRYPFTQSRLDRVEEKLYKKYPLEKATKCMIFYPLNKRYSTSCFKTPRLMMVNGREMCVPTDCDLFLKERYGNYMEYLPIKDRFNEFYKMVQVVEERQNDYSKSHNR